MKQVYATAGHLAWDKDEEHLWGPGDKEYFFEVDPLSYLVKWENNNLVGTILAHGSVGDCFKHYEKIQAEAPQAFEVSKQDIEQAKAIRDYYKAKMVNLGLRGEQLTRFRQRMYNVVNKDRSIFDNEIGILCKLVEFYREDTFMDRLLEDSKSVKVSLNKPLSDQYQYVGSIDRKTRHVRQRRYWFRNGSGHLATFYVDLSSAALPALNQYLTADKSYTISCKLPGRICLVGQDSDFFAVYLGKNYTIEECD